MTSIISFAYIRVDDVPDNIPTRKAIEAKLEALFEEEIRIHIPRLGLVTLVINEADPYTWTPEEEAQS
jgi:hypothetical protein